MNISKIPGAVMAFYSALQEELPHVGEILVTVDGDVGLHLASIIARHFEAQAIEKQFRPVARFANPQWAGLRIGLITFRWPVEPPYKPVLPLEEARAAFYGGPVVYDDAQKD